MRSISSRAIHASSQQTTPHLLLNLRQVTKNYSRLQKALPKTKIHYAIKSNNSPHLIKHLIKIGSNFDVASRNEIKLVLKQGANPESLIFSAPIKKANDISYAYQKGIRQFTFDSFEEVDKLAINAPKADVILRILVESEGSQCPMFNKFGVYVDEALSHLKRANDRGLHPIGLTFHVGSQCLNVDNWINALFRANIVWDEARNNQIQLSVINLGGGLPVAYNQDIAPLEKHAQVIKRELRRNFSGLKQTYIEPGRYMTDKAAIMVSTVIGQAKRGNTNWIYLDVGGFNGLFEIFEHFDYDLKTEHPHRPKKTFAVGGPTCDGMDIIRTSIELPQVKTGEKVFIMNAGAYSTSIEKYNGFSYPKTHTYS